MGAVKIQNTELFCNVIYQWNFFNNGISGKPEQNGQEGKQNFRSFSVIPCVPL
ncbi:MAG: hypothetical protein LBT09_04470 [Planctomycetaceae bacterium]|nr:hypothetical protein [Planctomycetaceae bacterium]